MKFRAIHLLLRSGMLGCAVVLFVVDPSPLHAMMLLLAGMLVAFAIMPKETP
jgi:hypothetical protein